MTGTPACANCGTSLYAQWWDRGQAGYVCRRCGTVNPGPAPSQGSTRLVVALSLVVVALWLIGFLMAVAVLGLYPDGPWRAAAIAALLFLLGGFAVLIGTIVFAVLRRE